MQQATVCSYGDFYTVSFSKTKAKLNSENVLQDNTYNINNIYIYKISKGHQKCSQPLNRSVQFICLIQDHFDTYPSINTRNILIIFSFDV